MPTPKPDRDMISKVISYCNENLISDWDYDRNAHFPKEWFIRKFDFLDDVLAEQLGEAFYQARLTYTLMSALNLPMSKNKGFIKFQIIQYASICEALLNYTIDTYFKEDFGNMYAKNTYTAFQNAMSVDTKITFQGKQLELCQLKTETAKTSFAKNPDKAAFACEKGILTNDTSGKYQQLYDLRNNAHLLKAASSGYSPKPNEAKEAYSLTWKMYSEIKEYIQTHP